MNNVVAFPRTRRPEGPEEPFRFKLVLTGDNEGNLALETASSRSPSTMPQLAEILKDFASWIELGCPTPR